MKASCTAILLLLAGPAFAQGMNHAAMAPMAAADPMTTSMDRMSKAMAAAPMTGDADRDFVAMMIPHHQGAVDMAQWELQHGKDPALKKMARDVIASQDKEIAFMKAWQAKHPSR